MPELGIAVVTYNRLDRLKGLVDVLAELTETPFELVVADDGSADGTAEWCRSQGLRVVTGENRGVCWNKNRGLYALNARGCEVMLLFEDDTVPVVSGWERDWIEATQRWHHLAYHHPKIADRVIAGSGTPEDPFVNAKATAQCTSISARALATVGYLDSRFKGYGVGHAEWTTRLKRSGFGFAPYPLPEGGRGKANLYITGGLRADDAPSFRDNEQVVVNKDLFVRLKQEPLYRDPWSDPEEREAFLAEQKESIEAAEGHAETQPEAAQPDRRAAILNKRRAKWDVGDVAALEAMRPLVRGFAPWTSFSLRPAALLTALNEIDYYRPRLVLELGSGVSTVYMARLLTTTGGRLVTVEHDADWANYISRLLDREGVSKVVQVVKSPLVPWEPAEDDEAADSAFALPDEWFDLAPILKAVGSEKVGLLMIDGPPGGKTLTRYPAIPSLRPLLAADAAVMLDDANRPAETEIAHRWSQLLDRKFTIYRRMSLAVGRLGGGTTLLGT